MVGSKLGAASDHLSITRESLPENEAKTEESRAKRWRHWVLMVSFEHLDPVIPDLRL